MKKRITDNIAYKLGYKAALRGESKSKNPFTEWNEVKTQNWNLGWRDSINESKKKEQTNEGFITKYIDAFFDGLKTNTVNRAIAKARKDRIPDPIISKMLDIKNKHEANLRKLEKETREIERMKSVLASMKAFRKQYNF